MAGNQVGGRKAAARNKELYGADFYRTISRLGGRASCNGGFASLKIGKDGLTGPQRARIAGKKGGIISSQEVKNYETS